jgi:hypothetical protein
MAHHAHHDDKGAAFTGMIVTAVALFIIAFTIVKLTNMKFAGHEAGAPAAAGAEKH